MVGNADWYYNSSQQHGRLCSLHGAVPGHSDPYWIVDLSYALVFECSPVEKLLAHKVDHDEMNMLRLMIGNGSKY